VAKQPDGAGITWTQATWNPLRGCSRVSEGCRNCYAEKVAYRFSGPGQPYEGLVRINAAGERQAQWNGQIKFAEDHLLDPLKWKAPRRIFVNSMSDLFHENVTDQMLDRIFAVMATATHQDFQILTKRPKRMASYLRECGRKILIQRAADSLMPRGKMPKGLHAATDGTVVPHTVWPLPNVWIGVSVEDQKAADDRLDYLCDIDADGWQTMVSFEPLLSALDPGSWWLSLGSRTWAIVGGESGPGARPMHPDWARALRDQCVAAGVPFFFKQWGAWMPWQPDGGPSEWKSQSGNLMDRHAFPDFKDADERGWTDDCLHEGDGICVHQRVGKKAAGRLLDGREWNEMPAVLAR
jgi:protein gp37